MTPSKTITWTPARRMFLTLSCCWLVASLMTSPTHAAAQALFSNQDDYQDSAADFETLHQMLNSLDSHLENFQKRGGCITGMMTHNCALSSLHNRMRFSNFLRGDMSPGKRSMPRVDKAGQDHREDIMEKTKTLHDDVTKQRQQIWRLKQLMTQFRRLNEENTDTPQKRSCSFRLGGHCLTEELDRMASQRHYLMSADSPGKRRRRSAAASNRDLISTAGSKNMADEGTARR